MTLDFGLSTFDFRLFLTFDFFDIPIFILKLYYIMSDIEFRNIYVA
jgi:hypothetical protein